MIVFHSEREAVEFIHLANRQIRFNNPPLPMSLSFEMRGSSFSDPTFATHLYLRMQIHVPDRDTGQPATIDFCQSIPAHIVGDLIGLARFTLDFAKQILKHELEESIHVAGDRVFDPHAEDDAALKRAIKNLAALTPAV